MNTREANDIALLMRAGALAAPMEIVEERTVGPSLGKENIDKGFNSVFYGFIVLSIFMCAYYADGPHFDDRAVGQPDAAGGPPVDVQATLTLPGIAAIARSAWPSTPTC
jgi:preprotein translocase subunit SecD